jgi:hypothetical protein
VWLEGLGKLKKKCNDFIGNRNRELPACNIVPQQTTLPRAPLRKITTAKESTTFNNYFSVSKFLMRWMGLIK